MKAYKVMRGPQRADILMQTQ